MRHSLFSWIGVSSVLSIALSPSPVLSQLVPDDTLGNDRSRLTPQDNRTLIEGGASRTGNLFHSFQDFNVGAGQQVYFNPPTGIDRILTRVTGNSRSTILGTLGVLGNADLFLLNPNGILFGAKARLDLRGSFLATTADRIQFDNYNFSATHPTAPPLLTITTPIGLQFGQAPGAIVNQSVAPPITPSANFGSPTPVGLAVDPGRSIALIGGDLMFDNGNLTASQGNIYLGSYSGSIADATTVRFLPSPAGWRFAADAGSDRGDIFLVGTATVNAGGLGGGRIHMQGDRIQLQDRARILSDTFGAIDGRTIQIQANTLRLRDQAIVSTATFSTGRGGDINVQADRILLSGVNFETFQRNYLLVIVGAPVPFSDRISGIFAGTIRTGQSGDINLVAQELHLDRGSIVISPTFGAGQGGNIHMRVAGTISVVASGVGAASFGAGNGGALRLETGNLIIRESGIVTTGTVGSSGRGGDLSLRAQHSVQVSGSRPDAILPSNLSTVTVRSTGDSGNLSIDTRRVRLERGGVIDTANGFVLPLGYFPSSGRGGDLTINASDSIIVTGFSTEPPVSSQIVTATHGAQRSGDLTIRTRHLHITDGGLVSASTLSSGAGGNVNIQATDSIEIQGAGRFRGRLNPSRLETLSGDLLIADLLPPNSFTGDSGELSVTTDRLMILDRGRINVSSNGTGRAGAIRLTVNRLMLDDRSEISATTNRGGQGNISIDANLLLLQNQSRITTNARRTTGGNIDIGAELSLLQDSTITADAIAGRGGNINVTTRTIFQDPASLITAASERNINGTVRINTSFDDPSRAAIRLPDRVVNESDRITSSCPSDQDARFTITNRGGLPNDPRQILPGQVTVPDFRVPRLARLPEQPELTRSPSLPSFPVPAIEPPAPLLEAQGWTVDSAGQVQLIASVPRSPAVIDYSEGNAAIECGDRTE